MTKRKRDSHGRLPVDVGLGATLALLKGEPVENNSTASVEDDDGGWTVVGAPKKKQKHKDHAGELDQLQSPPHQSNSRRRLSDTNPTEAASERKNQASYERNVSPPHFDNPFERKDNNDSGHTYRPSNPFSSKSRNGDEQAYLSTRSPPTKNTSRGRDHEKDHDEEQSREERRKERKLERNYPSIKHSHNARLHSHVKITDLQALVLYLLADGTAPQWVSVNKRTSISQVVMVMVPGLERAMFNGDLLLESVPTESADFDKDADARVDADSKEKKPKRLRMSPDDFYPSSLNPRRLPTALRPLSDIFDHIWPVKAQGEHRSNQYFRLHSPIHTMLTSQIPKTREEKHMKKSSNHKGPMPQNSRHWDNKRTQITEYIANLVEQQENEYVVHSAWYTTPESKEAAYQARRAAKQTPDDGWVDTNVACLEDGDVPEDEIQQGSVTAGRRVLAVDCEMCKAEDDTLVLTRISLLDWDGSVVLDKLVKPDVTIKDYLTQWSGITQTMLQDVTTTLSDIQQELLEIITPRTILVGHSLNSDLNALKLTHPFLIDTGILFPHARGPPYKQSLKWLAQKYLHSEIQKGVKGHDSVEDARACLNLVKQKCEKGPKWGTSETNAESIFKRLGRAMRPKSTNTTRAGAVVDWGDPTRGHGGQAQIAIGCKSDLDVVEGIERAVQGHAEGKDGATEKVDFIWGRLRELELARGWWDDAKTADVEAIRQSALKRLGLPSGDEDAELEVGVTGPDLGDAVSRAVDHVVEIYERLPRCTAFIVYSGTGDPREIRRLQSMHQQYKREYQTKNWDNLSVKWTDTEVQALSQACQSAREGVGFVVVK